MLLFGFSDASHGRGRGRGRVSKKRSLGSDLQAATSSRETLLSPGLWSAIYHLKQLVIFGQLLIAMNL